MPEHLYCPGNSIITDDMRDGWLRTFKGYPDMNDDVKSMLYEYADKGKFASILIFFVEKAGFDPDYGSFLMREVIRGYL